MSTLATIYHFRSRFWRIDRHGRRGSVRAAGPTAVQP